MKCFRGVALLLATVTVTMLSACGEKPQTTSARKSDLPAFQGTGTPYALADWKAGDAASWEQQLRNRAQNQNEYTRASAP